MDEGKKVHWVYYRGVFRRNGLATLIQLCHNSEGRLYQLPVNTYEVQRQMDYLELQNEKLNILSPNTSYVTMGTNCVG